MADGVAFQEDRVATPELSLLGACDQGDAISHRKIRERFKMLNRSRPASQNVTEVIVCCAFSDRGRDHVRTRSLILKGERNAIDCWLPHVLSPTDTRDKVIPATKMAFLSSSGDSRDERPHVLPPDAPVVIGLAGGKESCEKADNLALCRGSNLEL